MPEFTAESCHEIGYGWKIDAPEGINETEVESLVDLIINYDDSPTTQVLQDALSDIDWSDWPDLLPHKIKIYRKVMINVECVHREAFSQSIEEQK